MSHVGRLRKMLGGPKKAAELQITDMGGEQSATSEFSGRKLAIGVPSHDNNTFMFTYDLANLVAYTIAALPDDVSLTFIASPGTYVHTSRQEIADTAVAGGYDHLLWLDADMRFPPDLFVRLLLRRRDIVGINYAKRKIPTTFVAIKKIGWDGSGSQRLVTNEKSEGLEEADAVGFGALLVNVGVLRTLPDPKKSPWFFFEWMPEIGQQVGEDVWFCRLVKQHGHKIWVDHDLSKKCSHVGQWEYRLEHVQPEEY